MIERSDISHPMWRKKVDSTFLVEGHTPIPHWVMKIWNVGQFFDHIAPEGERKAEVTLQFAGKRHAGRISKVKRSDGFQYRLYVESDALLRQLREKFLMSYMRALESGLSKVKSHRAIEEEIPFWEFVDIEFDLKARTFILGAHYAHRPIFPELFSRLANSAPLKSIQDEIGKGPGTRIQKQGWKSRTEYRSEINATNVIYTLLDSINKLIYIGEAKDLVKRFDAGHSDIAEWDYYRFNALPDDLRTHRVSIERMAIRDMAALLDNKREIGTFTISDFKLANRKIDR